jgi:hypothetical protein
LSHPEVCRMVGWAKIISSVHLASSLDYQCPFWRIMPFYLIA